MLRQRDRSDDASRRVSASRYNRLRWTRNSNGFTPCGGLLLQPEMGSVVMVVADILGHQTFEMVLVEHDDVIEQISAATAHETFCDSVLHGLRKLVRFGSMPGAPHLDFEMWACRHRSNSHAVSPKGFTPPSKILSRALTCAKPVLNLQSKPDRNFRKSTVEFCSGWYH